MTKRAAMVVAVSLAAAAVAAVVPDGVAVAAPAGCATAFVTNAGSGRVATIDVATRTKDPNDISLGDPFALPDGIAITPDGATAFVANTGLNSVSTIDVANAFVTNQSSDTVSTIDVATRTKDPTDISVGTTPRWARTPTGWRSPPTAPPHRPMRQAAAAHQR